jgi:hypothetical protein
MSYLKPIYEVWDGNAEALAADIDESGVTVRQWRNRKSIPPRYWQKIIEAAAKRKRKLSLADFMPRESERERAA